MCSSSSPQLLINSLLLCSEDNFLYSQSTWRTGSTLRELIKGCWVRRCPQVPGRISCPQCRHPVSHQSPRSVFLTHYLPVNCSIVTLAFLCYFFCLGSPFLLMYLVVLNLQTQCTFIKSGISERLFEFYADGCFSCMCACVLHVCLTPVESKKEHRMLWGWEWLTGKEHWLLLQKT